MTCNHSKRCHIWQLVMAAGAELLKVRLVPNNDINYKSKIITYHFEDFHHIIFDEFKVRLV